MDMGASVIARLKNKAKETGKPFQLHLQLFCQEEFLRRLASSRYAENLVLKGGLFIYILKDLFCNEVICPNYYSPSLRKQVASLVEAGDLCYGSTLFSKPEQNYLNYILNKKEYSNGLDLRNKYAHDTCPLDEKTQQYDYWELQKIMVLIILKINEELCLKTLQQ